MLRKVTVQSLFFLFWTFEAIQGRQRSGKTQDLNTDITQVVHLSFHPHQGSGKVLAVRTRSETYYMLLRPNLNLPQGKESAAYHFHGKVISPRKGTAALSFHEPGRTMTGVIMLVDEALFLHPLFEGENSTNAAYPPHLLRKVHDGRFCGVRHPGEERNEGEGLNRLRRSTGTRKVIRTAIFVDRELYRRGVTEGKMTYSQLKNAVLAIINQVQIIFKYESLETKFRIVVDKLHFLQEGEEAPDPAGGDIDAYLDNFCTWQSRMKPEKRWNHAIMLSGYVLHKLVDGKKNKKVLGLAWVNGMCRRKYSCTLNEATSFEAAFVIAHEMGHSLGMLHDGQGNSCNPATHLMAEKTGPGRTTWSSCSNDYLRSFFKSGRGSCLEDDENNGDDNKEDNHRTREEGEHDEKLPGQMFDLTAQCKMSMGPSYKPHLTPKPPFDDVCRELWCASAFWASSAHPALEGSDCGPGKQCAQGKCRQVVTHLPAEGVQQALVRFMEKLRTTIRLLLS